LLGEDPDALKKAELTSRLSPLTNLSPSIILLPLILLPGHLLALIQPPLHRKLLSILPPNRLIHLTEPGSRKDIIALGYDVLPPFVSLAERSGSERFCRGGTNGRGDGNGSDDFAHEGVDGRVHAQDFFDEGREERGGESLVGEVFEAALTVAMVLELLGIEGRSVASLMRLASLSLLGSTRKEKRKKVNSLQLGLLPQSQDTPSARGS
jgi:hypothetical protein